ncbi:hypothetical protein [Acidihalobacter aeolianus]|nr:hypothetical protein [Acidihalobacter aeolianus]
MPNKTEVWRRLDELSSRLKPTVPFQVVTSESQGTPQLAREWAISRGHADRVFTAPWTVLDVPGAMPHVTGSGREINASAGRIRDAWVAAYATHLVAFLDQRSFSTRHLIQLCRQEEVKVPVWLPRWTA